MSDESSSRARRLLRAAMPVIHPTGPPLLNTSGGPAPVMAREIERGEMKE